LDASPIAMFGTKLDVRFGSLADIGLASTAFVAGRPHDSQIELTSGGLDIARHPPPGMIKEIHIVGATSEGSEGRSILVSY
jgi:hypothetical protein